MNGSEANTSFSNKTHVLMNFYDPLSIFWNDSIQFLLQLQNKNFSNVNNHSSIIQITIQFSPNVTEHWIFQRLVPEVGGLLFSVEHF